MNHSGENADLIPEVSVGPEILHPSPPPAHLDLSGSEIREPCLFRCGLHPGITLRVRVASWCGFRLGTSSLKALGDADAQLSLDQWAWAVVWGLEVAESPETPRRNTGA